MTGVDRNIPASLKVLKEVRDYPSRIKVQQITSPMKKSFNKSITLDKKVWEIV